MNRTFSLLFVALLLFSACKENKEKHKVSSSSLTESVYASLTVQPSEKYNAFSAVGGIVKAIAVTEGDTVAEGQLILQIDNSNPELNAENAKLAYELAKDNFYGKENILDELEKQIETAELKLYDDSVNYFRQKRLWEKKIGSQSEYEKRKLAYQLSENQLQLLKVRYQQSKNELRTSFKQAENNYKTSLKSTKDFSIRSEMKGKVYELKKERGEIVSLQESVALIGSRDSFIVEMLVDEVDISKISLGQKVLIRLDAYGKEIFSGKLSKIYPKMDSRSQTFKVEATFDVQADQLYPGLTGEANIIVDEKKGVITIPIDYLLEGDQVQTKEGLVKVETGIKNFDHIEIRSGLDTGMFIFKGN